MMESNATGRLLGYVQVRVGPRLVTLPVQAMSLDQDGAQEPGGFYAEGSQLGIYVDAAGSEKEVEEQIRRGSNEAMRHLARTVLN